MAKPIRGVQLSSSQRKWLTEQVNNQKVDPKKQAAVERREAKNAQRVKVD